MGVAKVKIVSITLHAKSLEKKDIVYFGSIFVRKLYVFHHLARILLSDYMA